MFLQKVYQYVYGKMYCYNSYSEVILLLDQQKRNFHLKSTCWPTLKDSIKQRVYSYIELCQINLLGLQIDFFITGIQQSTLTFGSLQYFPTKHLTYFSSASAISSNPDAVMLFLSHIMVRNLELICKALLRILAPRSPIRFPL